MFTIQDIIESGLSDDDDNFLSGELSEIITTYIDFIKEHCPEVNNRDAALLRLEQSVECVISGINRANSA